MVDKPLPQEIREKISEGNLGKPKSEEHRQKLADANRGKIQTEETKHKKSKALKGRPAWNKGKHHTEEARRKISLGLMGNKWNKGKTMPLEVRQKIAETERLKYQDPNERLKISEAVKLAFQNNPSLHQKYSIAQKKKWQDPNYKEQALKAILSGAHKRPTMPEKKLIDILQRRLPEYKYNGDYGLGVTLSGLVPDFVNVNGRKEIIEVFGDYWHGPTRRDLPWYATELGRIMAYQSLGYKCLIIWEHEVKELEEEQLIKKINTFFRRVNNAQHAGARR